jgi:hypothetical protein
MEPLQLIPGEATDVTPLLGRQGIAVESLLAHVGEMPPPPPASSQRKGGKPSEAAPPLPPTNLQRLQEEADAVKSQMLAKRQEYHNLVALYDDLKFPNLPPHAPLDKIEDVLQKCRATILNSGGSFSNNVFKAMVSERVLKGFFRNCPTRVPEMVAPPRFCSEVD